VRGAADGRMWIGEEIVVTRDHRVPHGFLPRYFALGFQPLERLQEYFGMVDQITPDDVLNGGFIELGGSDRRRDRKEAQHSQAQRENTAEHRNSPVGCREAA